MYLSFVVIFCIIRWFCKRTGNKTLVRLWERAVWFGHFLSAYARKHISQSASDYTNILLLPHLLVNSRRTHTIQNDITLVLLPLMYENVQMNKSATYKRVRRAKGNRFTKQPDISYVIITYFILCRRCVFCFYRYIFASHSFFKPIGLLRFYGEIL